MSDRQPIPRKKAADKRPNLVVLRLTDAELSKLVQLAREHGATRSELLRSLLEKA